MKPSTALQTKRAAISSVVECHNALNARVFGSVIHGDDHEGSDLDILVDPTPKTSLMDIAKIQVELEAILGVKVDVLTPNTLPDIFRHTVIAQAQPI
jgi:predicted nucleotidyltransferase